MKYLLLLTLPLLSFAGSVGEELSHSLDNHKPYCEHHCGGGDPSPTPEPATMGLMGLALVGGAVAHRVRSRR